MFCFAEFSKSVFSFKFHFIFAALFSSFCSIFYLVFLIQIVDEEPENDSVDLPASLIYIFT